MAATMLQINFKFDGSLAEYHQTFDNLAAPIADTPGLRWKIWPWNDEEKTGGGIYLFEDAPSAQAFLQGPIAAGLGEIPTVSDVSVKQFEIVDNLTEICRGPV